MLLEKFLYSTLKNSDKEELYKIRTEHLKSNEDVLDFVQDFYATYRKMPDVSTVEGKFKIVLTPNTEKPEYWRREIVEKYRDTLIQSTVVSVAKDSTGAIDQFQEAIIKYHSEGEMSVVDYASGADRIKDYKKRKGTKGITYVSTGYPELDIFSFGYRKADLWTIGGREGSGKTWQLLRMAEAVDLELIKMGMTRTVLIISGEMSAEELTERLDAIRYGLNYQTLSKGELGRVAERKYFHGLKNIKTNIKIIDSFDGMKDVEYYVNIYRPAICFIDGSHLLATSYDWKDISQVTSAMKRITRNNKVPILNTTHLGRGKGNGKENHLDDFAYTKGYTRDSDIVGLLFVNDMLEIEDTIGIDWLKVRRGDTYRTLIKTDRSDSSSSITEHKPLKEILASQGVDDDDNYDPNRDDSQHKSMLS